MENLISPRLKVTAETDLSELAVLLARWEIDDTDVDAVIVGDGSGTAKREPCGWAATVLIRSGEHRGHRKTIYGGMSTGSCGLAEVIPYIQALSWYASWRDDIGDRGPVKVAIVTDCETVANQGNLLASGGKAVAAITANALFWAAIAHMDREGYMLRYHWAARASSALNGFADGMAGICRELIIKAPRPVDCAGDPILIHDCNPEKPSSTPLDRIPRTGGKRRRRHYKPNSEVR